MTTAALVPPQVSYLTSYRLVICVDCRTAVRPGNGAETHWRQKHQLGGRPLEALLSYVSTLSCRDPHDIELPPRGSRAIPELGTPSEGFSCPECAFLTPNKKKWQSHASQTGHQGVGRADQYAVRLQTFSRGCYARYWVIDNERDPDSRGESDSVVEGRDTAFQQMLLEYQKKHDEQWMERRRVADDPSGVENQSRWVQFMRWAALFDGKDKRIIYLTSLMARPAGIRTAAHRRSDESLGKVDPVLVRVGGRFDRVVRRCAARLRLVPHETLLWLNSIDPMKPAGRPFALKQNEKSMYRYRQFMKRCLTYCVRVARLGRDAARELHGIRWTDAQWTGLQRVVDALDQLGPVLPNDTREDDDDGEDEQERRLDEAVFGCCIAMLQQRVLVNWYENPLLFFAAVLGINDARGSYREPKHYTGSLAGLVWCGRMLMLEEAFRDSPEDPNEMTMETVEQFQEVQRRWLAGGSYSPMSTFITWMAYGKGFRTKEGGMPKVLWEDNGQVMRYLGQPIHVDDFITTANAAVADAEAMLDQLIFGSWGTVASTVDLRRIHDSVMFEGTGSSFASDSRNRWLQPGFQFVAERARTTMWPSNKAWRPHQRPRLREVKAWVQGFKAFKQLLMVTMHIWGGQPGRGPEMTTLKHCDTPQVMRNVFVFDGEVMLITDRDKNRSIRGLGRKVARFLPARISRMVVAYIAWLVPFEEHIHDVSGVTGPDKSLWSYMWKDARRGTWDTDQLSDGLAALTGESVGVELMVSDYRHVAIGFTREIKGIVVRRTEVEVGEGEGEEGDEDEEAKTLGPKWEWIWDAQSTHGSVIAADHYAIDSRFPSRMQPEKLMKFREISRLWHRFLEGDRRGKEEKTGGTEDKKGGTEDKKGGKGKRKGEKEGRKGEKGETDRATATKTKRVERTTSRTHESGRKRARTTTGEVKEDSACSSPSPTKRVKRTSSTVTSMEDMSNGLERLLGRTATWRIPELGEAMAQVMTMRGNETLTVVLPTGAGKSVLFMLPALVEDWGTTVVIVPFAALMDDLVARACKSGIDCIRWTPGRLQGRELPMRVARMVVASADMEGVEQFQDYVGSLRDRKLLRRIFVDEAHTVIMDVSYRKKLDQIKGLHRYGCPVIALTATLPGVMVPWFEASMLMRGSAIVRACTVKRNIRYNVVRVTSLGEKTTAGVRVEVADEVVRAVLRMEKTMSGTQKGVVYVRSRDGCEELAARLGCDHYHSNIVEEGQRRATLQRWANGEGENRWIVATTGLGTGVDIPGIVAVVHMEQPYGLVDFVQQTGRGGRQAGEVVDSVVVMDQRKAWMGDKRSDVEHLNHQAMECFVESSGCRRVMIGMFMDVGLEEAGMDCEQLQAEMCDRCRAKHTRGVEDEERGDIENDGDGEHVAREGGEDVDNVEDAAEEEEAEGEAEGEDVEEGDEEDEEEDDDDEEDEEDGDSISSVEIDESCPNRLNEYVKEKHARLSEWRRWLSEVRDHCPVCYVQWMRHGRTQAWRRNTEHEIQKCPRMDYEKFKCWRKGLDFGEFDCCWRCALPQSMCRGLQDRENGSQGFSQEGCEWGDQIKPLLYWMRGDATWRDKIRMEFKFVDIDPDDMEWHKQQRYRKWLGRARRMYDEDMTNAIAVWDVVIREVQRLC